VYHFSVNELEVKSLKKAKIVIVGSGFYGCTMAERISSVLGQEVTILESRNHPGGNAYSYTDFDSGIEVHKYGSHLFHTNNSKIWEYVNKFDKFNEYRHFVWINSDNNIYSMPINLATISSVYGKPLTPTQAKDLIKIETSGSVEQNNNFEEFAISKIGYKLYNLLIKGYTWKQWEINPKELPISTFTRLPIRYNFNSRYFSDTFEGLPLGGYGKVFQNMLDNKLIRLHLNTDFFDVSQYIGSDSLIIYTGPIDRYFNYSQGQLSWRTLDFELQKLNTEDFQGCAVMNYGDKDVPFTRIHEFKHLHPERPQTETTIIAREFSRKAKIGDEPYYPVNSVEDRIKLSKYRELAKKQKNIIFGGRLGTYQYLDMHMAIAAALSDFENHVVPLMTGGNNV